MEAIACHVYGRVSFAKDKSNVARREDRSLQIQDELFATACKELIPQLFGGREGIIAGAYRDEGKSASKKRDNRPDFMRMLRDIEAGIVKILLVSDLSRLTRLSHIGALPIHQLLHKHKVILVCVDDRKIVNLDDFFGTIEVLFKSRENHEQARSIAKKALRGCLHSVKQGNAHAANTPYGLAKLYTTETGRTFLIPRLEKMSKGEDWSVDLVPGDTVEVETVRWIFSTYANLDFGTAYIARMLNSHENPLVRLGPTGNGWSRETITAMLQNPHYNGQVYFGIHGGGEHFRTNGTGDVVPSDELTKNNPLIVKGRHEPLIPDALFNAVQAKYNRRQQTGHKPKGTVEGHCLTGILVCQKCGRRLESTNPRATRYQCRNRLAGCSCWSVAEVEMLPFILAKIDRELLKKLDSKPEQQARTNSKSNVLEIDRRIAALEQSRATARPESIPNLQRSIDDLYRHREATMAEQTADDYDGRVRAAVERWEALLEPFLIPIKTDTIGEGNPAVKTLGIQDECDRLFNFSYARPSAIRQLLHQLEARVELAFTSATEAGKKRNRWQVDYGTIQVSIEGKQAGIVTQEGRSSPG